MASNFDRIMDELEKDRAKEKPAELVEREQRSALAQSIAAPYLKGLGPKVVDKLKELGIVPNELSGKDAGSATTRWWSVRWWSFEGYANEDSPFTRICLLENGTFAPYSPYGRDGYLYIPGEIKVGLLQVAQMKAAGPGNYCNPGPSLREKYPEWEIHDDTDQSRVFVDPDTGIVHVIPGNRTFQYSSAPESLRQSGSDPIPELGTYIANYIRYKMMKPRS